MPDVRKAIDTLKEPRVAIPVGALAVTTLTAGVLGFFLHYWAWVIGILAVLLILLVLFLIYGVYTKESEQRLRRGTQPEDEGTTMIRQRDEMRAAESLEESFERAFAVIREHGDAEELPWYLVVGPDGAGKTALLRASGLELPASVARLVEDGPTTSCNFWLTNQAILLDTAGRLTSSSDGAARQQWRLLLRLLRKSRPSPPIHGVLVVLSAPDLLSRSGQDLREEATDLRRHLNELNDVLGVDAPIYFVLTKADQVQGFVEAAHGLAGARLQELFGWTHAARHPHDAGEVVRDAFGRMRGRLEAALPDLLVREPDPARRTRLFLLPQELTALGRVVQDYVRRCFAPSGYDEAPFLRGIYLASALREGQVVSPILQKHGQEWAQGFVDASGPRGGWFVRDLFRYLLLDGEERTLAVPSERLGPRTRLAIYAAAGAAALAVIAFSGLSFWNNWGVVARVRDEARSTIAERFGLQSLDRLRIAIEEGEASRDARFHGFGLRGPAERGLERAQASFLQGFGREYEQPAKNALLAAVRESDDEAFAALQDLAGDVNFLALRGQGGAAAPKLAPYSEVRRSEQDRIAFEAAYAAFVRWAPEPEVQSRIDLERRRLEDEAPRLLDLGRLERWCEAHPEVAPPVRYADLEVPAPADGSPDHVPGCYTQKFWSERLSGLIRGLARSGGASQDSIEAFRKDYATRYAQTWERFLINTPRAPAARPDVKRAPYLRLVEAVDQNTRVPELWQTETPAWVRTLEEVRSTDAPDEKTAAPWTRYQKALEDADADTRRLASNGTSAYDFAKKVSAGEDSSFKRGVTLVNDDLVKIEPGAASQPAKTVLRDLLTLPFLDGFSYVLESVGREVDNTYRANIASRFNHVLTPEEHQQLYDPANGELARFKREVLQPFVVNGRVKPLLVDRGVPLTPRFLDFVEGRRGGPGGGGGGGGGPLQTGPKTVRLAGVPSDVVGGGGMFVTSQSLTLVCGTRPEQRLDYVSGVGEKFFTWTPDCNLVQLVVRVRGADGREAEIPREWSGPMAFPDFLRDGASGTWTVSGAGVTVKVRYKRFGGEEIMKIKDVLAQGVPSSATN